MDFSNIISGYQGIIHSIAEIVIYTLELVGIIIIVLGTIKSLVLLLNSYRSHKPYNVVIDLGRSLALALECKMGAERIHTVIVRDLKELGILAVVILIRALLAFIIHWEIRLEQKAHQNSTEINKDSKEKDNEEKE